MKAKITEIFQSIQGEGPYAGAQQVFVRFFACNMHCVWCDTPDSIGDTTQQFEEMDLNELIKKIIDLREGCHSVSLTGGEPLLQKEFIRTLLPRLKREQLAVYLETNGIFHQELREVIDEIDIVAMDIKLPSSTGCKPFWREHEEFLKIAMQREVFVKTVISCDTKVEDVIQAADLVASIDPSIVFILQPNHFDMDYGVMTQCLNYQKDCLKRLHNVKIIPQMHKMMNVR